MTGNPRIPRGVETKTLSHDYLMFMPEQMDGTAFSKSDAVRWGMISQRIHVTLRNHHEIFHTKGVTIFGKDDSR